MGNGGALPDKLQASAVILPALNYMFDPAGGLPQTQVSFRLLKRFYRHLGDHADHDQGTNRRERTLRHLGWLLTAEMFDDPSRYPYPNDRFRLWLRYLTWLEHIAANYTVTVDGQPSNLTPAAAIKRTILRSIQNNTQILFDWGPAGGAHELTVDVMQTTNPMRIVVTSIKQEVIPNTIYSDDDDVLDQT
jgi:hypothetical protein